LIFFNKLFDENDWDVKISLKCINQADGTELCNLIADRPIKKDENIVYVR